MESLVLWTDMGSMLVIGNRLTKGNTQRQDLWIQQDLRLQDLILQDLDGSGFGSRTR